MFICFNFIEIEQIKLKENEEKLKLKAQINSEKKLTEEAVKKLFQIVQEKKNKSSGLKNGNESKRLEKEYKRLQLELSKERENYAQMHKVLNQEIQSLKEDLDKREHEIFKCRTLMNNSLNSSTTVQSHHSNHHHHNHMSSSGNYNNNGASSHNHHSINSSNSNNTSLVVASSNAANGVANTTSNNLNASSPLNSTANLSSYSLTSINNNCQQHHQHLHNLPFLHHQNIYNENSTLIDSDINHDRLENWLSIPNKRNIKKHGWKKLYVVLRKGKLFFYNSLKDNKESQEPYMTIDLEKVYHVRAVTQTDVVRAGTRDVAKIFQILYDVDAVSGPGSIMYLGANDNIHAVNSSMANSLLKKTGNLFASALDNSPSILSGNHGSSCNNNNNHGTTLSTTTLQNPENFSDSAISTTMRSINGIPDEYSARLNPDSISVGSNDSGEVNKKNYFLHFIFF